MNCESFNKEIVLNDKTYNLRSSLINDFILLMAFCFVKRIQNAFHYKKKTHESIQPIISNQLLNLRLTDSMRMCTLFCKTVRFNCLKTRMNRLLKYSTLNVCNELILIRMI